MNPFVEFLKRNELLPCLFFIFSRAKCEKYCKMIQKHLITTEESCLVDKIFNSKLAKYKYLYEKTPQYNELYSLLKKGVAYHHSGVIPVLKEIVEILFEQGLVKILFCTETLPSVLMLLPKPPFLPNYPNLVMGVCVIYKLMNIYKWQDVLVVVD